MRLDGLTLEDRIFAAIANGGELTRSGIQGLIGDFTMPQFYAATASLIAAGRIRRIGRTKGSRYALPGMRWEQIPTGRWVADCPSGSPACSNCDGRPIDSELRCQSPG